MLDKFDSFKSLENDPKKFIEDGPDIAPDEEDLNQRVDDIELDSEKYYQLLFDKTKIEFEEKVNNKPDAFKKAYNFALELKDKHDDARSVALFHVISGSTIDGMKDPNIKKFDFEGEDSIAKFIDNL